MGAEICLLLAAERSGTHLLRSLLTSGRGVAAPGEICNVTVPQNRTAMHSFFRYRQQACLENPELFFPTETVQEHFLDNFVEHLRSIYLRKELLVLDVKYAHVHNFNYFWCDPLNVPYLIRYAKRKPLKIIHLVRRKVFRTAISDFYASQTGIWRAKSQAETRHMRVTADARRLYRKAELLAGTIARFEDWLSTCPHLQIYYEDMMVDGDRVVQSLQTYLDLKHTIANSPGYVKTTPPLEEALENFAEIAPLIDLDWTDVSPFRLPVGDVTLPPGFNPG